MALGAAVTAAWLAACTSGAGERCERHADCAPGLACSSNNECVGCGDEASCLGIDLVVKTCDPAAPDVFAPPVQTIQVTVEGGDMAPIVRTASVADRRLIVPQVPYGTKRRIVVEAFEDPPGAPLARGASSHFDVDPETPTPAVSVFLRATSVFSKTNSAVEPTSCTGMNEPRASHTATLLSDGRVLIAGGYRYVARDERAALRTVERFDPRTGAFEPLAGELAQARAGHTAHLLPDGRVLIIGGYSIQGGSVEALKTAEIYDPSSERSESISMQVARMEHASAMLSSGVVVVSGGISKVGGGPLNSIEVFRPNQPAAQAFSMQAGLELKSPRAGHAAIALRQAAHERVLFIGGTSGPDGERPLKSVEGFGWLGATLIAETGAGIELAEARPQPSVAEVKAGGAHGIFVVGATERGVVTLNNAWDWLPLDGKTEPERVDGLPAHVMPTYRYGSCLATLPDGALVAGGVESSPHQANQSVDFFDTVDAYRMLPNDAFEVSATRNTLSSKRKNLACTTLADGAILVTGGEELDGALKTTTAVAEMYLP